MPNNSRVIACIVAVLVFIGLANIVGHEPAQQPAQAPQLAAQQTLADTGGLEIRVVDAGEVSEQVWQQLRDLGYRGDPNDGAERLYVPVAVLAQVENSGCWVEHKEALPDELVCGDLALMPVGSSIRPDCWMENFGTEQDQEWVAVSGSTPDGLCLSEV